MSSIAQGESEAKREAMLWSIDKRFSRGQFLTPTNNLLGYNTDADGNMVIDEEGAKTVIEKVVKRCKVYLPQEWNNGFGMPLSQHSEANVVELNAHYTLSDKDMAFEGLASVLGPSRASQATGLAGGLIYQALPNKTTPAAAHSGTIYFIGKEL